MTMTMKPNIRVGFGVDAHRLVAGRPLILGGVEIPFEKGLLGHSDADVLLHAVMDAILGAAALGDIGEHFPDSDERYRGISSLKLLGQVGRLLFEAGYALTNLDATLIAEEPKIGPYKDEMRANIAEKLGVDISCVSVKATTMEGMGETGEGLGMKAVAVALVEDRNEAC